MSFVESEPQSVTARLKSLTGLLELENTLFRDYNVKADSDIKYLTYLKENAIKQRQFFKELDNIKYSINGTINKQFSSKREGLCYQIGFSKACEAMFEAFLNKDMPARKHALKQFDDFISHHRELWNL